MESFVMQGYEAFKEWETRAWKPLREGPAGKKMLSARRLEDLEKLFPNEAVHVEGLFAELGGSKTFSNAISVRSQLMKNSRRLAARPGSGMEIRKLKKFEQALEQSMEEAIRDVPGAKNAWEAARKFTAEGAERFYDTYLSRIILTDKVAPEKIGGIVYRHGNVENVRIYKRAMEFAAGLPNEVKKGFNYDEAMQAVKAGYMGGLWNDATGYSPQHMRNITIGGEIIKKMTDRNTLNTMKEIFSAKEIREIYDLAQTASIIQTKPPGGGEMVMQLMQGRMLVTIPQSKGAAGKAATIIMAPPFVGHLFSTDRGRRLLFDGMKTPIKTQRGVSLSVRFLAEISRIKRDQAKAMGIPEHVLEMVEDE